MKKALIVLTILASAVVGARASFFTESFNYPDGGIVTNSAGTWANFSGTANSCLVSNQTLQISTSRAEDITHLFTPGYTYDGVTGFQTNLYARITFMCTNATLPTIGGAYFFGFGSTAPSLYMARTWLNTTNLDGVHTADAGYFYMGVGNQHPASNSTWPTGGQFDYTHQFTTNIWYTVVVRHCLTNGNATLWVGTDPTTMTESGTPSVTATDTPSTTSNIVDYVSFRQNTGEGYLLVKNLKVGGTWNDVFFAPEITTVSDQNIPRGGSTPALAFTVSSATVAANKLTVTASSSNQSLVPNGSPNIVLTQDATYTNCTVTVTPASILQGSTVITLTVSDGTDSSSTSFKVKVGAPTIAAIPNQIMVSNTISPAISFTVSDPEGDPVTLSVASSWPSLIPTSGITLGSSGSSSNVTITPLPNQIGYATITISATDGYNTNSSSFVVTVYPLLGVIFNENFAYITFDQDQALYDAQGGSGGPWYHVSGPDYEIQVTNFNGSGFAYLVYTNNEDLGAAFIGSAVYNGTNGYVFYTSFTVDCTLSPTYNGEYFFHLSASGTDTSAFRDKVYDSAKNAATNRFRFGIANTATAPAQQFPRDLMTNATYAVITRYNSATGDSTLWVNPINEQSASVTASDAPGTATIGGVALRQPGDYYIGDLTIGPMKVGTAFSDVWTAPAQPVLHWMTDGSGNLILSWDNPLFVLQSASVVTGPYTDLTPTSPYTNSIGGQQYFRLRY